MYPSQSQGPFLASFPVLLQWQFKVRGKKIFPYHEEAFMIAPSVTGMTTSGWKVGPSVCSRKVYTRLKPKDTNLKQTCGQISNTTPNYIQV